MTWNMDWNQMISQELFFLVVFQDWIGVLSDWAYTCAPAVCGDMYGSKVTMKKTCFFQEGFYFYY